MTADQEAVPAGQHSSSRFDGTGNITGAIDLHEKSPLAAGPLGAGAVRQQHIAGIVYPGSAVGRD